MRRLFRQFSFPGGMPSHVAPETPGSIHEGGELGYSLAHAYGAAFDNPDLVVACVIGDGEAETGPLAASWHSNKFLDPARDGIVLPILHLNGYKIANPTVLARIPEEQLIKLMEGYGYRPHVVAGDDPKAVHRLHGRHPRHGLRRDRRDQARLRRPAPDDHPAYAEGLDRPEARSTGCRWRAPGAPTRCRSATVRGHPERLRHAGGVAALLPPGGAVRRRRPPGGRDPRPGAEGAAADERATRTPTAARSCARWCCPTSATTRWRWPSRRPPSASRPGCSARSCAT